MKNTLGQQGEVFVQHHIKKMGWKLLEKNMHSRFGEIDIIAEERGEIVFIEVKTRSNEQYGRPEESVTKEKIHKMMITAQLYLLERKKEQTPYRFDVFSVREKNGTLVVEHFKNISV